MATVQCPDCRSILELDDSDLGRKVQCGSCQAVFNAEEMDDSRAPRRRTERDRPSRRRDDDDDDRPGRRRSEEARYDDEDRPRRRRNIRDDERGDDLEDARRDVAAPATTMLVFAIVFMVIGAIATLANLAQLGGPNGGPQANGNNPALNAVSAVVTTIWGMVIAIGAYQMKTLKSHGWAMTAAIMGMIPCSGCCLFTLPVGIWMLTVLNKPHVKDSFG